MLAHRRFLTLCKMLTQNANHTHKYYFDLLHCIALVRYAYVGYADVSNTIVFG